MLSIQFFHLNLTRLLNINVADPDPGSRGFLTPVFGRREGNQDPDRDEQPRSYFRELRSHFFGVKILKFFDADPESGMERIRIWDGKIRIRAPDKYPGSATLLNILPIVRAMISREI
jgi:hypothetical protein